MTWRPLARWLGIADLIDALDELSAANDVLRVNLAAARAHIRTIHGQPSLRGSDAEALLADLYVLAGWGDPRERGWRIVVGGHAGEGPTLATAVLAAMDALTAVDAP